MLNGKQERVMEFIRRYVASNQQPPTIAEIGRYFQMTSSASVHAIVVALEDEGLITRTPHVARGIALTSKGQGVGA